MIFGLVLDFFFFKTWHRSVVPNSLSIFCGLFARVFFCFALLNAFIFAFTEHGLQCESNHSFYNVADWMENIDYYFGLEHPLVRFYLIIRIYSLVMCMTFVIYVPLGWFHRKQAAKLEQIRTLSRGQVDLVKLLDFMLDTSGNKLFVIDLLMGIVSVICSGHMMVIILNHMFNGQFEKYGIDLLKPLLIQTDVNPIEQMFPLAVSCKDLMCKSYDNIPVPQAYLVCVLGGQYWNIVYFTALWLFATCLTTGLLILTLYQMGFVCTNRFYWSVLQQSSRIADVFARMQQNKPSIIFNQPESVARRFFWAFVVLKFANLNTKQFIEHLETSRQLRSTVS